MWEMWSHPHNSIFLTDVQVKTWQGHHRLTNWKQLRTLGSMLLPPNDATSPSCLGIWIESCSRRPRRRWSQNPVALATCLKRSSENRSAEWVNTCRMSAEWILYTCGKINYIMQKGACCLEIIVQYFPFQ